MVHLLDITWVHAQLHHWYAWLITIDMPVWCQHPIMIPICPAWVNISDNQASMYQLTTIHHDLISWQVKTLIYHCLSWSPSKKTGCISNKWWISNEIKFEWFWIIQWFFGQELHGCGSHSPAAPAAPQRGGNPAPGSSAMVTTVLAVQGREGLAVAERVPGRGHGMVVTAGCSPGAGADGEPTTTSNHGGNDRVNQF